MPYPSNLKYLDVKTALGTSRSYFPNATTLAEFRPNSLTAHFHYLSRETLASIEEQSHLTGADVQCLEVLAHELTHWSDQVSSVWGQEYLICLFDAYHAMAANQEQHLHKIVRLFDVQRRVLLPLYYQNVVPGSLRHDVTRRWQIAFSVGEEFDAYGQSDPAHPIIFVRFGDHQTGELIARQPITVGALLETTATWAELVTGMAGFHRMPSEEALVERKLWAERHKKALYNPDLTVYTAPAHMLASLVRTTDVLQSYEFAAVLANVALNLTDPLFDRIAHPADFNLFGSRLSRFVSSRNRGYVFAALAKHSANIDFSLPLVERVAMVLAKANLPPYEDIMYAAYAYLEKLGRGLPSRSSLDPVRDYVMEIGLDRFAQRTGTVLQEPFDSFGARLGVMPPMFDCNGNQFSQGAEVLDPRRFDAELLHVAEWRLRVFTDNFLQGCRGFTAS